MLGSQGLWDQGTRLPAAGRPLDPPYKMAAASAEGTGRRGWGEETRRAPGLGRPVRGDGDQGHRARGGRSGMAGTRRALERRLWFLVPFPLGRNWAMPKRTARCTSRKGAQFY